MSKSLKSMFIYDFLVLQIVKEVERMTPLETGGILMGCATQDLARIRGVIGPGARAHHSKTSFTPDYDFQIKQVAKMYRSDQGIDRYLGDWHSHPGGSRYLSSQDRLALKSIAASPEALCPDPIMVIVSGSDRLHLQAWQWISGTAAQEVAVPIEIVQGTHSFCAEA